MSDKRLQPMHSKPLISYFFNRAGILLFNSMLTLILISATHYMVLLLLDPANDTDKMERTLEGIATIFVAYGVVLEERESLMKFFRYYPLFQTDYEERIDHICHDYGVVFLLIGLLMEVIVQLVKIPDRVIDTANMEPYVLGCGILFFLMSLYYMAGYCYRLLRVSPAQSQTDLH